MEDERYRMRGKRKRLRVVFPSGKSICHQSVITTLVETLKEIGSERFPEISLQMCKMPLLSQEVYKGFEKYMKPVCDGWYVNTQSATDSKYLQLRSISDELGLGLTVEIGDDLEVETPNEKGGRSRTRERLIVTFPDGTVIDCLNSQDTYLQTISKLGVSRISKRDVQWNGRSLVTVCKEYNRQVEMEQYRWVGLPGSTKERYKLLRVISLQLHEPFDIQII